MDPAQRVTADVELASVVADDHGVAQQPVRHHAAPERALGGALAGRLVALAQKGRQLEGLEVRRGRGNVQQRAWNATTWTQPTHIPNTTLKVRLVWTPAAKSLSLRPRVGVRTPYGVFHSSGCSP